MKSSTVRFIAAVATFAILASSLRLFAQDTRYKLIVIGTFGGPQSWIGGSVPILNHNGTLAGQADTAVLDPDFPNINPGVPLVPQPDPYISHAFRFANGVETDLGALPGGRNSSGFWVSDKGEIIGGSENGVIDPNNGFPSQNAVVWKHGQIMNLGTLKGGHESGANAINNRGQIVGFSDNDVPDPFSFFSFLGLVTQTRAFLWEDGIMQDLGTLGGPDAIPGLINESGQIAGVSYTSQEPDPGTGIPPIHPFLWERGTMMDLGTLGGAIGFASGLNNRGEVVGTMNLTGDSTAHPFLWERGTLTDLGTLGGSFGQASWINEAGEIVGNALTENDAAFLAFLWKNGSMKNLGTLEGSCASFPQSINSKQQVVGQAFFCNGSPQQAVLWQNGSVINLNSFVPAGSDLILIEGNFVNERGEIVGTAVRTNGEGHAFMLVPCGQDDVDGCMDASLGAAAIHHHQQTTRHLSVSEIVTAIRARQSQRYYIPALRAPRN
jgi:probable HAF family extracellular repeat protein